MKLTYNNLWLSLLPDERQEACLDIWRTKHPLGSAPREQLLKSMAELRHFRPAFLKRKSADEKALMLFGMTERGQLPAHIDSLIRSYLLERHGPMIACFLDAQKIQHHQGVIDSKALPPTKASLERRIRAILDAHPRRIVNLYVGILLILGGDMWRHLREALEAVGWDSGVELLTPLSQAKPPPDSEGPESAPENSDEFTTLDNVIIKGVVATALEEDAALASDQMEDLIEEVIALSHDRPRTFFHRGFYHALFDHPLTFGQRGENEQRRIWYFSGVLFGLIRRGLTESCIQQLREQKALVRELVDNSTLPCGRKLLPHLYPILVEGGEFSLCRRFIAGQARFLDPASRCRLVAAIVDDAAEMLRDGKAAPASLLLKEAMSLLDPRSDLPEEFVLGMIPNALRKMAQACQLQGDFGNAEKQLLQLIKGVLADELPGALTDLGLIKGGFRSLASVLPTGAKGKKLSALRDALSRGISHFRHDIRRNGPEAVNAHFVMGIYLFLKESENAAKAADHLQVALTGMLRRQQAYEKAGLIGWARFILAISLLEMMDTGAYQQAADLVEAALAESVTFPMQLWERCLHAAALFDDQSIAEKAAKRLLDNRGRETFALLQTSGLLEANRELRQSYLEWLVAAKLPVKELWRSLESVSKAALRTGALEQAELALDSMERLADQNASLRPVFVQFLEKSENYSPVWDEWDVENLLVRIFELQGKLQDAAALLSGRFYQLRAKNTPWALIEARDILDRLKEYKIASIDLVEMEERLPSNNDGDGRSDVSPAEDYLRADGTVSVLFIGGNETQRNCEKHVRQHLAENLPGLRIAFYYPGWDSGWNAHLEKVQPQIRAADAVVLSYLVRTTFGRHVRKTCDGEHPWFACTGKGRKAIRTSIREAALWAATQKMEAQP